MQWKHLHPNKTYGHSFDVLSENRMVLFSKELTTRRKNAALWRADSSTSDIWSFHLTCPWDDPKGWRYGRRSQCKCGKFYFLITGLVSWNHHAMCCCDSYSFDRIIHCNWLANVTREDQCLSFLLHSLQQKKSIWLMLGKLAKSFFFLEMILSPFEFLILSIIFSFT